MRGRNIKIFGRVLLCGCLEREEMFFAFRLEMLVRRRRAKIMGGKEEKRPTTFKMRKRLKA